MRAFILLIFAITISGCTSTNYYRSQQGVNSYSQQTDYSGFTKLGKLANQKDNYTQTQLYQFGDSGVKKDTKYIGNLNSNQYDPNSVSNPYGKYGSKYSADSINNPYGKYGSKYSNESANNPYATNAPKIYDEM